MKNKDWLWWDAWHLQHSTNLLLMTFSKQSILLVDELEARLVIGCLGKHEMLSLQTFIEPAHDTGDGHQVSWLPRTLKLWELWRCQRDCWVHVILVLVKHSWNFDSGRYYVFYIFSASVRIISMSIRKYLNVDDDCDGKGQVGISKPGTWSRQLLTTFLKLEKLLGFEKFWWNVYQQQES